MSSSLVKRDTTGDTCKVCNKGRMLEGCIEDDWGGTLTCTNCKVKQLRYELVLGKESENMNNEGMMFIQDDDSHWYLIPISLLSLFRQLEEHGEADYYASFNSKFEEYRCDHPTTYTVDNVRSIYEC